MSSSKILFKDYTALQNVSGGKTWGDIVKEGYLTSIKNTEFFNNMVASPTEITGDNIVYEFGAYTSNDIFDNTDLAANDPIVSKQTYQMPANFLSFKYNIANWGQKEASEWGKYLSETESKINEQILNINQFTIYKGVVDYCVATGAIRLLPNISKSTSTKAEKLADLENVARVADAISYKQTIYNLGQNQSRIINGLSPTAYRGAMFALNTINSSDKAFDVAISGEISLFNGYQLKKVGQLGQAFNNVKSYDGVGYDFSKVIGITYSLDTLAVNVFSPIWELVPNGLQSFTRSVIWKMLAHPKPSMEHLNMVYMAEFPTIDEINKIRAELFAKQPMAYSKLVGGALNQITTAEYNALKANATNFDLANTVNLNDEIITKTK